MVNDRHLHRHCQQRGRYRRRGTPRCEFQVFVNVVPVAFNIIIIIITLGLGLGLGLHHGLGLSLLADDDVDKLHHRNSNSYSNNNSSNNFVVVFAVSHGNNKDDGGNSYYYHYYHHRHQPPHRQQPYQQETRQQDQKQNQHQHQRPRSSPSMPSSNFRTQYQMIDGDNNDHNDNNVHDRRDNTNTNNNNRYDYHSDISTTGTMLNPLWREIHVFTGERRGPPSYHHHHSHHHHRRRHYHHHNHHNHHQQQQRQQGRVIGTPAAVPTVRYDSFNSRSSKHRLDLEDGDKYDRSDDDDDENDDDHDDEDDDDRWISSMSMTPSLLREDFVKLPSRRRRRRTARTTTTTTTTATTTTRRTSNGTTSDWSYYDDHHLHHRHRHKKKKKEDTSQSQKEQRQQEQEQQKQQQSQRRRRRRNHGERSRVRGGGGGGSGGGGDGIERGREKDHDGGGRISEKWIQRFLNYDMWISSNDRKRRRRRSRNLRLHESHQPPLEVLPRSATLSSVVQPTAAAAATTTTPTNETRSSTPTSIGMKISKNVLGRNVLTAGTKEQRRRQGVGFFYGGATSSTSVNSRPRRAGRLDVDLFVPSSTATTTFRTRRGTNQIKSPRQIRYLSSTTSRSTSQRNATTGEVLPLTVGSQNESSFEETTSTFVDTKRNLDEHDKSMSSDLIRDDNPHHKNQQQRQPKKKHSSLGKIVSTVSNQMMVLIRHRLPSGDILRNTGDDMIKRSISNDVEKHKSFQLSLSIDPISSVRLTRQLLVVVVTSASAFVGTLKLIAPMIVARRCLNIVLFVFYDHMNGRLIRTTYTKRMVHLQQFEVLAGLRSVGRIVFQTVSVGMAGWIMSLFMDLAPCVIEPLWICNAGHACAWVATVYVVEWFTQTWLTAQERYQLIKIRPTQFSSTLKTRKNRHRRNDNDRLQWDRALMPGAAATSTTSRLRSVLAEIPQMIFQRLQDPEEWVDSMLRPILGGGQFARYYSSTDGNPRSMRPTRGIELDALLFPSTWTPLRLLLSLAVGVAIFKTYEAGGSGMFDDYYRPSILRRLVMRSFVFQEAIHSEWFRVFVHERRIALGSIFSLLDLTAYIAMMIPIVAVSGQLGVFLLFPPLIARLVSGWMTFLLYHDRYWNGSFPGLRYWPFVRKKLDNNGSR